MATLSGPGMTPTLRARPGTRISPRSYEWSDARSDFRSARGRRASYPISPCGPIRRFARTAIMESSAQRSDPHLPAAEPVPEQGARIMEATANHYAVGDLRVSDADRDRAVSELSEAFQAGRITHEEFEQRSGQALSARTGNELSAL